MAHNKDMSNRNANVLTALTLTSGTEVTLRHRNSLVGFANALSRKGLTAADVTDSRCGL
jgi:hypothetical protein